MLKNIIGDWGSGLSDGDYACALAALGVLEATGTEQHRAQFRSRRTGGRAAGGIPHSASGRWSGARRRTSNKATTVASWRETVHADAAVLVEAWRKYSERDCRIRGNGRGSP